MRKHMLMLLAAATLTSCGMNAVSASNPLADSGGAGTRGAAASVSDLPLHAVGTQASAPTFAVFLTGDGGWAAFDQRVCADLAQRGVPTIGFDAGAYFSVMRSPEEAAQALARTLRAGMQRWHAQRAIVIGYSFGADVMPFLVDRLPQDLRAHIDRVALMAPSTTAPFQVTAGERVGLETPGGRPILPELQADARQGLHIVCIYGATDRSAICPTLRLPETQSPELAGGHGFNGKDDAVAAAILSAWRVGA